MTADVTRWAWATTAICLWLSLWIIPWRHAHRQRRSPVDAAAATATAPLLIAYATQSGQSAQWAQRTARTLSNAGRNLQLLALEQLDGSDLRAATNLLLLVSTTGEGDAPDHAAAFCAHTMRTPAELGHLRYGLLARGDRSYANFCAFGRRVDAWLRQSGAAPAFASIEVDGDDEAALQRWLRECTQMTHSRALLDDTPASVNDSATAPSSHTLSPPHRWQLLQRHVINPGSPGAPVHHVVLQALDPLASWQAGDVARVQIPGHDGSALWREYSLASLPHEGRAEFLVREVRQADGSLGLGSGWLCQRLALGDTLQMQIRRNPGFHAPAPETPLLLIGNGTGLAGLLAHLKHREQARLAGQTVGATWLMLGERSASSDRHCDARLQAWRTQGLLQRLDRVFSREHAAPALSDASAGAAAPMPAALRYVQDLIGPQADALREWVAQGAAIYVCGQRDGMGQGVLAALQQALGAVHVNDLMLAGRLRRDLY